MSYFIRGNYKVVVAGQDVTSRFRPLLKDLSVERSSGKASDSLDMTLADPGGSVFLPRDRDPVVVHLNGQWVFEGFVSDVECSIDKGGGHEIKISASSVDQGGKAKEPSLRHKDNATLKDVASEWGGKAGIQMQVLGSLASVERDYWLLQNESFMSWGQRIAREVGATFKIIGQRGFLSPRNEGIAASGRPLTPIAVTTGEGGNFLQGSVSPIVGRPRFSNVALSYFDRAKGERVEVEIDTGITGVDTTLRKLVTEATEGQAKKKAEAFGKESDREKGSGSVTIVGDARAEPEAICNVSGFRPGVDGAYQIDTVSHSVSKGDGFTTELGLKQPKGGAGSDSR